VSVLFTVYHQVFRTRDIGGSDGKATKDDDRSGNFKRKETTRNLAKESGDSSK
jgi:hypothetical protein